MTTELAQKLEGVRDFRKILETVVKELGEQYSADVSSIVLSNPLDRNLTSVCEYKLYPEADPSQMPVNRSFALPLQGTGMGTVNLARQTEFHENELNWIRITLAELCDIIRHAQINDVVQRDTFRSTFLFEIQNVMQYSLGLGDALFMVVNILGKVLNVSRCLFICVDDTRAGFKCYEFWQRDRGIKSCQDYGWPTTDSPIVARSLLAREPMIVMEANQNSYLSPVQEELQLLDVRSLMGVPLRTEDLTHGCVILQHCEARHQWTRGEMDMVQSVADTVAEALAKLPAEKLNGESKVLSDPLLRLHQRDVIDTAGDGGQSILSIRRSLRQSLGQASIPSAAKTSAPKPPVPAVEVPAPPAPTPTPTPQPTPVVPQNPQFMPVAASPVASNDKMSTQDIAMPSEDVMATIGQLANSLMTQATGEIHAEDVSASLSNILGGMGTQPQAVPQSPMEPAPTADSGPDSAWGDLNSIPTPPSAGQVGASGSAPTTSPWGNPEAMPAPAATGTPTGQAAAPAGDNGSWGDLDSIPTPSAGSAKGLSSMLGKRNGAGAASPLLASLHRDKSRFEQKLEYVDGGEIPIDDAQAQARIAQVMQQTAAANPTGDYLNSFSVLDPRMAIRIESWISQVEEKDRYGSPHAMAVAEYSAAIARLMGIQPAEVEAIRLAALLHDIGKIGLPANILQKPEQSLEDTELLWKMKHPIDGANLLETFPDLAHMAPIILHHHEEFNGNGYPAGLAGDQIPLASRIIHVASDYHDLVSPKRTGEPGLAQDQAHAQLRANAGQSYDPQVVEALIACATQGLVGAVR
jgi:putative nucleotidyltransferase with HDIG domain